MTDARPPAPADSPAELAAKIRSARDALVAFVEHVGDDQWVASPLEPSGDPRSVGVIVDHVADSYGYLSEWIQQLCNGETVEVDNEVVDRLNLAHSAKASGASKAEVVEHLDRQGASFVDLIGGLSDDQFALADGRVARLANIALLHTNGHREELEAAIAART